MLLPSQMSAEIRTSKMYFALQEKIKNNANYDTNTGTKNAGAIWCYGIYKHCKDDRTLK